CPWPRSAPGAWPPRTRAPRTPQVPAPAPHPRRTAWCARRAWATPCREKRLPALDPARTVHCTSRYRKSQGAGISAVGVRGGMKATQRSGAGIMARLEDKVAVITGATSGMALATAKLFVEEGAYVFITGRRQEQLDAAVKEIGKNVTGVQGDAGNLADLDRLYETVKAEKDHVDILYAS